MALIGTPLPHNVCQPAIQGDFSCGTRNASAEPAFLEGRKVKQIETAPTSVFHKLLDFLKKVPLLGSLISFIEEICRYVHKNYFSSAQNENVARVNVVKPTSKEANNDPMLDGEEIERGIREWAHNMYGYSPQMPDRVTAPTPLAYISAILNRENQLSVSPLCIPLHTGFLQGGHWTVLVIHDAPDGAKNATLFNSLPSCGTDQIRETLTPLLREKNIQPLQLIAYNLQQHLLYGCGVFTVAAIDAVMTNHGSSNPRAINQVLEDFAAECNQRSPDQQDAWSQEWRGRMAQPDEMHHPM